MFNLNEEKLNFILDTIDQILREDDPNHELSPLNVNKLKDSTKQKIVDKLTD